MTKLACFKVLKRYKELKNVNIYHFQISRSPREKHVTLGVKGTGLRSSAGSRGLGDLGQ